MALQDTVKPAHELLNVPADGAPEDGVLAAGEVFANIGEVLFPATDDQPAGRHDHLGHNAVAVPVPAGRVDHSVLKAHISPTLALPLGADIEAQRLGCHEKTEEECRRQNEES